MFFVQKQKETKFGQNLLQLGVRKFKKIKFKYAHEP